MRLRQLRGSRSLAAAVAGEATCWPPGVQRLMQAGLLHWFSPLRCSLLTWPSRLVRRAAPVHTRAPSSSRAVGSSTAASGGRATTTSTALNSGGALATSNGASQASGAGTVADAGADAIATNAGTADASSTALALGTGIGEGFANGRWVAIPRRRPSLCQAIARCFCHSCAAPLQLHSPATLLFPAARPSATLP